MQALTANINTASVWMMCFKHLRRAVMKNQTGLNPSTNFCFLQKKEIFAEAHAAVALVLGAYWVSDEPLQLSEA